MTSDDRPRAARFTERVEWTEPPENGNLVRHQIIDRLNRAAEQLEDLSAFLVTLAMSQNMDPMRMQYPDGQPAMAPIVTAQAQVLAALAQLEVTR